MVGRAGGWDGLEEEGEEAEKATSSTQTEQSFISVSEHKRLLACLTRDMQNQQGLEIKRLTTSHSRNMTKAKRQASEKLAGARDALGQRIADLEAENAELHIARETLADNNASLEKNVSDASEQNTALNLVAETLRDRVQRLEGAKSELCKAHARQLKALRKEVEEQKTIASALMETSLQSQESHRADMETVAAQSILSQQQSIIEHKRIASHRLQDLRQTQDALQEATAAICARKPEDGGPSLNERMRMCVLLCMDKNYESGLLLLHTSEHTKIMLQLAMLVDACDQVCSLGSGLSDSQKRILARAGVKIDGVRISDKEVEDAYAEFRDMTNGVAMSHVVQEAATGKFSETAKESCPLEQIIMTARAYRKLPHAQKKRFLEICRAEQTDDGTHVDTLQRAALAQAFTSVRTFRTIAHAVLEGASNELTDDLQAVLSNDHKEGPINLLWQHFLSKTMPSDSYLGHRASRS